MESICDVFVLGLGKNILPNYLGAGVICELRKNVNHNSKFTGKICELGSQKLSPQNFGSLKFSSQKFGSRTRFDNIKKILHKNL